MSTPYVAILVALVLFATGIAVLARAAQYEEAVKDNDRLLSHVDRVKLELRSGSLDIVGAYLIIGSIATTFAALVGLFIQ